MIGQRQPENLSYHLKTPDCEPHGRAVLGSLTLLLSTRVLFPNKISCFVSTCVSSDNSFPSVGQEPSFGPQKGYAFLQQFDLLAVQGTLRSLLQHHSSKASIWCSVFFMVQLSHLYMMTGKIVALIMWNLVSKVMSLLFNTLSMCII